MADAIADDRVGEIGRAGRELPVAFRRLNVTEGVERGHVFPWRRIVCAGRDVTRWLPQQTVHVVADAQRGGQSRLHAHVEQPLVAA